MPRGKQYPLGSLFTSFGLLSTKLQRENGVGVKGWLIPVNKKLRHKQWVFLICTFVNKKSNGRNITR